MKVPLSSLETTKQRLEIAPAMGGAVTRWDWKCKDGWTPLFRRWPGYADDRYTFACFPLVPWSNRITQGGFEYAGRRYPIRPNRENEPYPIHGDGWLQAWHIADSQGDKLKLALESHHFHGDPYEYVATQTFSLLENGLDISLDVTNIGDEPLPFGLGLHPYFMRNDATRLTMHTTGVWLSGGDPIPVRHETAFPPTWDYNRPAPLPQDAPMIDNCFTGWDGKAVIDYPDKGLSITMRMENCTGYTLMYRPPGFNYFCLEPITHPIDAFHMPGMPALKILAPGEAQVLTASFIVTS